jgi:hypothetical protein
MSITQPKTTPIIPLNLCEFDRARKVLKLASEYFGMPREFEVESHATGKVMRFISVSPGDPLFDQDQWDGVQQVYRPYFLSDRRFVDHMVIYNQY